MLQVLRKGAGGWVAKIFLGLLVLSFGIWGIEDVFRIGGVGNNAAKIGSQEISVETFRRAYTNEIQRVSEQAKRAITPEMARIAGFGPRVLGNLINEAALDQQVEALGLAVSDDEVAREITNDEIFRGAAGAFDRGTFDEILRRNNLREKDYIALQRGFTARKQLTDALTVNFTAPAVLREALHAYGSDSRSISFVTLAPEQPSAVPAPTDAALQTFYDERNASFAAPEYRKVALLTLEVATIAATKQVSDAELQAYYDQNKPNYVTQERRSIEQLTFPSMEEAKAASDRIKAGGLFEQEMVKRKITPKDAFIGDLTKAEMFDKKIADAAFALAPNTVSEPVEGAYMTVLLRVTGVQQEQVKAFADVKEDLRKVVAETAAKADLQASHDKIDEARLGGSTLDEIAKAQNLKVSVIDQVDATGKGPDGQPVAGAPDEKVLTGAFQADVNAENDPVSVGDGYVWYEVQGVTAGRQRTFEEAKAAVEAAWREDETRKRLTARADALIGELNGGKTLEQVAGAQKLMVEQAETTRTGGAPAITPEQANAVFAAPAEGFGKTAANDQGARLVFHVTAENNRPFDPKAADTTGQAGKISEGLGQDVVSSFVSQLRNQLGTTVNQNAVAQVVGGGEG